jgi:hypothetical protein
MLDSYGGGHGGSRLVDILPEEPRLLFAFFISRRLRSFHLLLLLSCAGGGYNNGQMTYVL